MLMSLAGIRNVLPVIYHIFLVVRAVKLGTATEIKQRIWPDFDRLSI